MTTTATDVFGELSQPRHNIEMEQAILGCLMEAPSAIDGVVNILQPDDFYRPAHRIIYETITRLYEKGEPFDAVSVCAALMEKDQLSRVGHAEYLHKLMAIIPIGAQASYFAKKIIELSRMRTLVNIGQMITQMGQSGDPGEIDGYFERAHEALVGHHRTDRDPPRFGQLLYQFLDHLERGTENRVMVPAPYADLTEILGGGFHAGQLIVVGARPAVGKSVVALDIARHATVERGIPAYFASLEMDDLEVVRRGLAAEALVPMHRLRPGQMTDSDWDKVSRAVPRLADIPLILDDNPRVTLTSVRASLRRAMRRTDMPPVQLLVVDYLQLAESTSRVENRQVQVSEMTRGFKLIAKEFKIPVVLLSQLNRKSEDRPDRKPQVSDLRESGAIEQDSDVVLLLHREDVHDRESPRAGEMDIIVGKNRNGPTGIITTAFQGHYARSVSFETE